MPYWYNRFSDFFCMLGIWVRIIMILSMFRWRGGYELWCGIWTLPLCPLWGFWLQILSQTVVLLTPQLAKVYFIKFKLFSSPKGWKVHQKNADIDTCITPCKLTKLWHMGFCVLEMLNPSFHNSAIINLLIHPMTCF